MKTKKRAKQKTIILKPTDYLQPFVSNGCLTIYMMQNGKKYEVQFDRDDTNFVRDVMKGKMNNE